MSDIKLDYVAERSRWKSLCAPFMLLPVLVLLYLWVGQSSLINFMEYKLVHAYDSSFNIEVDTLDEGIHDRYIAIKESISEDDTGVNTDKGIIDYVTLVIIVWAMLLVTIYSFLYSLLLFMPVAAFLLCTGKYPKWLYSWNKAVLSYMLRVVSYFLLVSPNFPSIDDDKDITVTIDDIDEKPLNRWLPLVKWFLVLPHVAILCLLFIAVIFVGFFSYLYAATNGTYPKFAFNFITGYLRWSVRVICYSQILVTDKYPPFSLK